MIRNVVTDKNLQNLKKRIEKQNYEYYNRIISSDDPKKRSIRFLGKQIGKLHVDSYIGYDKNNYLYYWCTCECGNRIITNSNSLGSSKRSCGCNVLYHLSSFDNTGGRTHGKRNTRLYSIWINMRSRVSNPNCPEYKNYGGRGIKICPDWYNLPNGFINFYNWAYANGYSDYYELNKTKYISIDRINNNGNYCPENCRFVSNAIIQANNKTTNSYITYKTYTYSLQVWERITGISSGTLKSRKDMGWNDMDILTIPPINGGHNHSNECRDYSKLTDENLNTYAYLNHYGL